MDLEAKANQLLDRCLRDLNREVNMPNPDQTRIVQFRAKIDVLRALLHGY